ncbi:hypothetical protein IID62_03075 [candidate division KSB1 bacterium]|nr:hypothetical protein [candidate division KSB1 bacterium]
MSEQPKGSVLIGFLWMFFLSILLVWLPVIGQFIAGFVGGKRAGGVGSALLAFFFTGNSFFTALYMDISVNSGYWDIFGSFISVF